MAWSKIKTIILVILLGVNLILLSMVGYREHQSQTYEQRTRAMAVDLLASNGIALRIPLPEVGAIRVLQVDGVSPQDAEEERRQVSTLLGEGTRGEALAGGMRTRYSGANGSAEFSSGGEFTFSFPAGVIPLEGEGAAERGRALLAGLGVESTLRDQKEEDGALSLTYCQQWEGVPVFTCRSTLTCRDGWLVAIKGQRIFGAASSVETGELLNIATVLSRFLAGMSKGGYACSEVTGLTQGYQATGSRPFRLSPVWAVRTDTGEYYIDAVTGAFRGGLSHNAEQDRPEEGYPAD